MRITDKAAVLAATDLSNFLACRHRSALDLAAAMGKLRVPAAPLDVALKLLREKGAAHERAYVEHLRAQGLTVVEILVDAAPDERVSQTVVALKSGADVICQGAFAGQGWIGYADFCERSPVHLECVRVSATSTTSLTTRSWRVRRGEARSCSLRSMPTCWARYKVSPPSASSSSLQGTIYRPGVSSRGLCRVFPYGSRPDAQGAGKRGRGASDRDLPRACGAL